MAHVIDTRNAGGELVVLGDALTLPSSSNQSQPLQGSLRFNPLVAVVEYYDPVNSRWTAFGTGSANGPANGATSAPLVATVSQLTSNRMPIGSSAYASDGRKPSEYDYGFAGRVAKNTAGTGVPVFFGFAATDGATASTSSWLSVMDGLPVQP